MSLRSATGGRLHATGTTTLRFAMVGITIEHSFFVFKQLPYEVVMGMDFITNKGLVLDMEKRQVSIPNNNIYMGFASEVPVDTTEEYYYTAGRDDQSQAYTSSNKLPERVLVW